MHNLVGDTAANSKYTFTELAVAGNFKLNGKSKCTHQVVVAANKGAPAINLKTAPWVKWQFQWVEWDSEAMTGDMVLNVANLTPAFLGKFGNGE